MEMKVDIISMEKVKPSSPTPSHLKNYKLSSLDQSFSGAHIPLVLFYSASDVNSVSGVSERLKNSLSKTLTRYYPLAGKQAGNSSIHCSDEGALFKEGRANISLSEIAKKPENYAIEELLPFHPYRFAVGDEEPITGVQLTHFDCGGIAVGVCVSHAVCDGTSMSSFFTAWAATATGSGDDDTLSPRLVADELFPAKEWSMVVVNINRSLILDNIVTRRYEFTPESLVKLKTKFGKENPTRNIAVTALLWKTAMSVKRDKPLMTIASHAVNFRPRMNPPLPEYAFGNLFVTSATSVAMVDKNIGLEDLAARMRKSLMEIDGKFVDKLRDEEGAREALGKQMKPDVEYYRFTSWLRFSFYETDFGWGKPIRVCPTNAPLKNLFYLLGTKCGGVEVWANLDEKDVAEFENNEELLQFVSNSSLSIDSC